MTYITRATRDEILNSFEQDFADCLEESIDRHHNPELRFLSNSERRNRDNAAVSCLDQIYTDYNDRYGIDPFLVVSGSKMTIPDPGNPSEKISCQTALIRYLPNFSNSHSLRSRLVMSGFFDPRAGNTCTTDSPDKQVVSCIELAMRRIPPYSENEMVNSLEYDWKGYKNLISTVGIEGTRFASLSETGDGRFEDKMLDLNIPVDELGCLHPKTGKKIHCYDRLLHWGKKEIQGEMFDQVAENGVIPIEFEKITRDLLETKSQKVVRFPLGVEIYEEGLMCTGDDGEPESCVSRYIEKLPEIANMFSVAYDTALQADEIFGRAESGLKECLDDNRQPESCIEKYVRISGKQTECLVRLFKSPAHFPTLAARSRVESGMAYCFEPLYLSAIELNRGGMLTTISKFMRATCVNANGKETSCFDVILDQARDMASVEGWIDNQYMYGRHITYPIYDSIINPKIDDPKNYCVDYKTGKRITCLKKMIDGIAEISSVGIDSLKTREVAEMFGYRTGDKRTGSNMSRIFSMVDISKGFIPVPGQQKPYNLVQYTIKKFPEVAKILMPDEKYEIENSRLYSGRMEAAKNLFITISKSVGFNTIIKNPVVVDGQDYGVKKQVCSYLGSGLLKVDYHDFDDHGQKFTRLLMDACSCPGVVEKFESEYKKLDFTATANKREYLENITGYRKCYDNTALSLSRNEHWREESTRELAYSYVEGVFDVITGVYAIFVPTYEYRQELESYRDHIKERILEYQFDTQPRGYEENPTNVVVDVESGTIRLSIDTDTGEEVITGYIYDIYESYVAGDGKSDLFKKYIPFRIMTDFVENMPEFKYETYYLTISRRYADFLRASTAQPWTSCFDQFGGRYMGMSTTYNEIPSIYIAYMTSRTPYDATWENRTWIIFSDCEIAAESVYGTDRLVEQSQAATVNSVYRKSVHFGLVYPEPGSRSGDYKNQILISAIQDVLYGAGYRCDPELTYTGKICLEAYEEQWDDDFYLEDAGMGKVTEDSQEELIRQMYYVPREEEKPVYPFTMKLYDIRKDPLTTVY